MTRRRRSRWPVVAFVVFANCTTCPPSPPAQPFRCTLDSECSFYDNFHCDMVMQTCVGQCNRNQVAKTDQTGATICVDNDGPGMPCTIDNDCPNGFSCGELVTDASDPSQSPLAKGTVCVETTTLRSMTCDAPGGACTDINPSNVIDAKCVNVRKAAEQTATQSTCLELCYPSPPPSSGDPSVCRPDQVAVVANNRCSCLPQDPYGNVCTGDRSTCNGLPQKAWVGDPRECRRITGDSFRCVDEGFCIPETLATCKDNIDQDCDGVAEAVEPTCQVEVCPDNDGDGYTEVTGCMMAYVGAIPTGFSTSGKKEANVCDNDPNLVPPLLPDQGNPKAGDQCFVCTDNFCIPIVNIFLPVPGQGCRCPGNETCNPSSYHCDP